MLASSYGWTHEYIQERVYPLDYFRLRDTIHARKASEYLMQLSIATNPTREDQKPLWDRLQEQAHSNRPAIKNTLDLAGMAELKKALNRK